MRMQKGPGLKPLLLFLHGFKGFKDWGPSDLIANYFANKGFIFVKMNLSHNGTSVDYPQEFVDLESFAQNTFSIELDDIGLVLEALFLESKNKFFSYCDFDRVYLLGHSRGGTLGILKACEDSRIKAVCSCSAVSHYPSLWRDEELRIWKEKGMIYVINQRIKKRMPVYYQVIEDFFHNKSRLDLSIAIKHLQVPLLVVHAKDDCVVPVEMAYEIQSWYSEANLLILDRGGHAFGGVHPFVSDVLPATLAYICRKSVEFFNR